MLALKGTNRRTICSLGGSPTKRHTHSFNQQKPAKEHSVIRRNRLTEIALLPAVYSTKYELLLLGTSESILFLFLLASGICSLLRLLTSRFRRREESNMSAFELAYTLRPARTPPAALAVAPQPATAPRLKSWLGPISRRSGG